MKNIIYLSLFVLSCAFQSIAQTPMLSNQGALISVKGNAFVAVHGDVQNDKDGTFHNSNALHLWGDWENNANNEAFTSIGEGVVHLRGSNQTITGTSITRFYDLRLENLGIKHATIDVYVDGFLRLNDREFDVDSNVVHVFNTNLTAVEHLQVANNWGFVSSLKDGGLLRHTNTTAAYFYPVGSTQGTARFRPVNIHPTSTAPAAFKVRMANVDASLEGWDRNLRAYRICELNPNFYHRISRTMGTEEANVELFFDAAQDGNFADIGQWTTANIWDVAASGVLGTNTTYNLDTRTSQQAISSFTPNPFILTRLSPTVNLTVDPSSICSTDTTLLTASSSGAAFSNYDFYVDTFLVQSGSLDYYNLASPRLGEVPIWVVGSFPDCGDVSDTTLLTVYQGVTATAYSDTIIIAGTSASLTATGGDFYNWLPDTALSCNMCATTIASPLQTTTYWVEVENIDGCKDTASVLVDVREDINQVVFIPNVLTPNNDGFNDTWRIKNIQLFPKNAVRIVNRWGDIVFRTDNYQNDWEGTYSGGQLPAGTYYYVLDIGGQWGVLKGDVTIIRE
ncbi:gliding motility-associated C-terminal domain-containing protein [Aureispira anguillae]|uniref:Gliding motility-associated C-terminal domain-containing protein n=1 Tax=Aureispira anguillae TaxID=2864201 RepID=A0A916DVV2_9BACT|nr:gliding motility-associated C-terminal domain-containing protein [Aureispira anguillae]BDS15534.1 gliding motility-associated C-terminal domain-containing protein [Aureispira anguillae]